MATKDPSSYDDDAVAELLKRDAKAASLRYASAGLKGYLPAQRSENAPKPNKRFLQNILRETDSHNAALLAREAEESKARLKAVGAENDSWGKRNRHQKNPYGDEGNGDDERSRRRQRHWHEEERGRSRRYNDDGSQKRGHERKSHRHRSHSSSSSSGTSTDRDHGKGSPPPRERRRHRRSRERSRSHEGSLRRDRRDARKRRRKISPSRSRSLSSDERRRSGRHQYSTKRKRRRTRSPPSPREAKWPTTALDVLARGGDMSASGSLYRESQQTSRASTPELGPSLAASWTMDAEPVKARGRGAQRPRGMMDEHFNATYNPSTDVGKNDASDEDDWGSALEALHARQQWKNQGADRLREAGFSDEAVKKWEKGDTKDASDVKWNKRGEGREWDRGKVVDTAMGGGRA